MGVFLRLALGAILLVLVCADAEARRVALVIGNGSYAGAPVLRNPLNDAGDIAASLRRLGFEVVEGYDLGKRDMERTIGSFADALDGAEAGVFYYAGHGISVGERDFLVPVDADLKAPAKLRFESIQLGDIVDMMRQQTDAVILILDACRNNPFARGPGVGVRSASEAGGGLDRSVSYAGAYTVYSAQEQQVALDGINRNSPFAAALLKHIATPGARIETMMGEVKREVEEATNGFQSPDARGLLTVPFSFAPETGTQVATRSVDAAENQEAAASPEAQIESLVRDMYLRATPDTAEAYVRRLFADSGNTYGFAYSSLDELVAGRMAYLRQFSDWQVSLLPGSLSITVFDAKTAAAIFNMHYRNTLKSGEVQEGNARVTLEMELTPKGWRIAGESAAALP